MRTLMLLPIVILPLGCAAYAHEVDLEVTRPTNVWVESPTTHARVEPPGPGARAYVPGTRDYVEREDDGTLKVDGRTVVGPDGVVSPPRSLDDTERDEKIFQTSACVRWRRGAGCTRSVWLATPKDNLKAALEHDVPLDWLGWAELLGAAGLVGGGIVADATRDPHTTSSGGDLLVVAGVIAAVVGIAQLAEAPKNEHVVVEPP